MKAIAEKELAFLDKLETVLTGVDYLVIYVRPEETTPVPGGKSVRYRTIISDNLQAPECLAALLVQAPGLLDAVNDEIRSIRPNQEELQIVRIVGAEEKNGAN